MTVNEIDFRVWSKKSESYVDSGIGIHKLFSNGKSNNHIVMTADDPERDDCWVVDNELDFEIYFWTGFKDCEGNKIYDGDMILYFGAGDNIQCLITLNSKNRFVPVPVLNKHRDTVSKMALETIYKYSKIIGNRNMDKFKHILVEAT